MRTSFVDTESPATTTFFLAIARAIHVAVVGFAFASEVPSTEALTSVLGASVGVTLEKNGVFLIIKRTLA